jgi:hypothetical protein
MSPFEEKKVVDHGSKDLSPRRQNLITTMCNKTKHLKKSHEEQNEINEYGFVDSGIDTCSIGGHAWVIDSMTSRKVQVAGYDNSNTIRNDVPIVSAITAIDLPTNETINTSQ